MRVGFVGFGLIGGSIARALRDDPVARTWTLSAWSPSGAGPAQALADGTIDRAPRDVEEVLEGADLIVLAGPPTACLEALDALAGAWRSALADQAVVTDVASTKGALVRRADALGIRFVGGHPMAGLETTGYEAARGDLFGDRRWVIVPGRHAADADVARVTSLVEACRARPIRLDADVHDRAVAAISHLPLILSAALVEAVAARAGSAGDDWPIAASLAAGGWRDTTRLARGDPAMGAGIAATNARAIAERLDDVLTVLERWRADLERAGGPDESAIAERLAKVRAVLEALP